MLTRTADVDGRHGQEWRCVVARQRVDAAAVVEIGQPTDGEPILVQYGDAAALDPDAEFEALSLTKTMVAAVALQLVDEGLLTLDGPLPPSTACHRGHRHAHAAPPAQPLDRLARLPGERRLSRRHDPHPRRRGEPRRGRQRPHVDAHELRRTELPLGGVGDRDGHGQPLSEVLDERMFEPLGMDHTGWSTTPGKDSSDRLGWRRVDVGDLAHWYNALMRTACVLADEMLHEMIWGGRMYQRNAGLGSWRHCPCDPPSEEYPEPFLYTYHDGGDIRVVYIPSRDVVLAMRFSKPLYDADQIVGTSTTSCSPSPIGGDGRRSTTTDANRCAAQRVRPRRRSSWRRSRFVGRPAPRSRSNSGTYSSRGGGGGL